MRFSSVPPGMRPGRNASRRLAPMQPSGSTSCRQRRWADSGSKRHLHCSSALGGLLLLLAVVAGAAPSPEALDSPEHRADTGFALWPPLPFAGDQRHRAGGVTALANTLLPGLEPAADARRPTALGRLQLVRRTGALPDRLLARLLDQLDHARCVRGTAAAPAAIPHPRSPAVLDKSLACLRPRPGRPKIMHPFGTRCILEDDRLHLLIAWPPGGLELEKLARPVGRT